MIMLAACPFCGGRASYSRIPGQGFSILCSGCGAIAMLEKDPAQDALGQGWNRRTIRHNFSVQQNIRPCPFCASRASLSSIQNNHSILKCSNCGMMVAFVDSNDTKSLVQSWNRRTGSS